MIIEFGQYKIDVDVDKTRQFYENMSTVGQGCSCDDCQNFDKAVGVLPETVTAFFDNMGVDLRKTIDCYNECYNDDGTGLYVGFYHVCGTVIKGESAWKEIEGCEFSWDDDVAYAITPDFRISISDHSWLLDVDFPPPAIQIEFSANIPWVLDSKSRIKPLTKCRTMRYEKLCTVLGSLLGAVLVGYLLYYSESIWALPSVYAWGWLGNTIGKKLDNK